MSSSRSRKSSGQSTTLALNSPTLTINTDNPNPPSENNFMYRVMAERMITGSKRPIRPKQVYDELVAEESDDPDFEMNASDKSGSDSDNSDSGSKEDSDNSSGGGDNSGDSSNGSEDSASDSDSPVQGNSSSLRAAVKKMKEDSPDFNVARKTKKKRKPKVIKPKNEITTLATIQSITQGPESNKEENIPTKSKSRRKPKVKINSKSKRSKTKSTSSTNEKKKSLKKKLKRKLRKRNSKYESITQLVNDVDAHLLDTRKDLDWFEPICAACLSSISDSSNEIFECDSCRITVHEGCYILDDNSSVSSRTESSSSTEPWFCNACRNNLSDPSCELCPNPGGLFKETSDGRWVHLVCSLYVREIVIGHDGKPNISNIPYSKWGSRACQLCDNEKYTHVGICIPCDAGFCRFFTHVTCAQKLGLLSIPNPLVQHNSEQAADPYFASCRAHTNADVAKQRAMSYKRLQEQVRIKKDQKSGENLTEAEKLNLSEVQFKLDKIRRKVGERNKERHSYLSTPVPMSAAKKLSLDFPSPGTSKNLLTTEQFLMPKSNAIAGLMEKKKSRLLYSSAFAIASFEHKAERMGLNLKALETEVKQERLIASVSRKWNVHPALNVEFAAYYADREVRIDSMSEQCERLDKENYRLNDEQIALNSALENEALNHMEVMEETFRLDAEINKLKTILKKLVPGNKKLNGIRGANLVKLKSPPRRTSPSLQQQSKSQKGRNSPRSRVKKGGRKSFNSSPSPSGRLALFQCALCERNDLQHLITRCDHCKQHFHLGCLDPPLTRMPKRSRLCGWMCSDCGDEDLAVPVQKVDTEAPRELRGRTKIKRPAKYTEYDESDIEEEFLKREHKYLGPLSSSHPVSVMDGTSQTKPAVQMQVRVKMEPLQSLPNGNVRVFKRDNSPSPGPSSVPKKPSAPSTRSPAGKTSKKSRTPRRKNTTRVRRSRVPKKEKLKKNSPKSEAAPKKRQVSGMLMPEFPSKRARRSSGISQNSIQIFDVVEKTANSPETSPLTAAEKNKVDARSSSSFVDLKHLAISNIQPGVWIPSPPNVESQTSLSSFSPDLPKTQKKPRKQKIITKETDSTPINSTFWNCPEDLIIVSGPPLPNALNYNTVIGSNSPVAGKCDTCGKSDPAKNLVMCDKCRLEFHFLCLDPPLKYTPKRRGYSWFCANCDETSSIEIDMGTKVQGTSKSPH